MLKPRHLEAGDKVAIVSSSKGTLGEDWAIHKLDIARKRLENDFHLVVEVMPNALKGIDYLYRNPKARADDLMQAFSDGSIKGIINSIGGDDSIRLLPYMDFDVIRNNPKIFTGFSDSTSVHLMLYKAGLISYYGASLMTNFAEYVKIHDYTSHAIKSILFETHDKLEITSSPYWYDDEDDKIWWKEENSHRLKEYHPEEIGYEMIQGSGIAEGRLLGGCLDTILGITGTSIWPSVSEWKDKIMFLETSEEDMSCDYLVQILRNFAAQSIFDVVKGIIVGKPARRSKYEPYKEVFRQVVGFEAEHPELPIMFNVNFGHAEPIGIIPYGITCSLDADRRTLTLVESATL
ncbi:S66 family peptidase [Parasphaerochaeta coccoides]|uniref:Peptidase U61 LD-carboxypeptidase A n=1 Tax=Parasphaerochaeta coccoides (strain ATCC BAA-1237 / DSM 17374 / SPN1) TaxID=760011 RepID=F4GLW1_PARC1|nr:S66 peptidase family protein [Parasphaerochaeta coccoides]AEC03002.1 peptidase U61 LD-carboxypeptidase A [Parasphaerochaeta coccoides DSM 17374]